VNLPAAVRIREVGPRDGIQSERAAIPTRRKAQLIDALSATGLRYIEAVSFVSPRAVPQMADALDVWQAVARRPEVFYSALVPNRRGAETAVEVGLDGLQVVASVGGMGGSPFATGASGNIATEDLVRMLEDSNFSTGVSLDALLAAARLAQELVEGELPGRVLKAGPRAALPARPSRSA
jgi:isopropylmalate/homocitrate/citramalate synthase